MLNRINSSRTHSRAVHSLVNYCLKNSIGRSDEEQGLSKGFGLSKTFASVVQERDLLLLRRRSQMMGKMFSVCAFKNSSSTVVRDENGKTKTMKTSAKDVQKKEKEEEIGTVSTKEKADEILKQSKKRVTNGSIGNTEPPGGPTAKAESGGDKGSSSSSSSSSSAGGNHNKKDNNKKEGEKSFMELLQS